MSLTIEERLLLDLLRSQITGEKLILPEDLSSVNWKVLMREAAQQAVMLMAFEAISAVSDRVSPEVYERWMQMAYAIVANNAQVAHSQNELVKTLDEHGYSYVILKGLAAASDYPRSDLRMLGDVDFLIDPSKTKEIETLLLSQGFVKNKGEHPCHVVLKKPGAYLEMHFEIAGIPFGEKGDEVREKMRDILVTSRKLSVDGATFSAPDVVRHGLVILLHMQGHMLGEGLGLRHLCDWGTYVHKTGNSTFWTDDLLPFLEKIGLKYYAAVMAKTASIYLGTYCPYWAENIPDSLCSQILGDIFAVGNFGQKDHTRSRSSMMVSQHGKDGTSHNLLYNLYHALHDSTTQLYPIVKRVRILHPFFDCVRIVRYLWLSLMGKRPSVIKLAPIAEERRGIYEQLHIFETEQ